MPVRLSSFALAAIGLARKLSGSSTEKGSDDLSNGGFDDLVEDGEEAYDEFLLNLTKSRDDFADNAKKFAADLLQDLGVATRVEIEELKKLLEKDLKKSDGSTDADD